MLLSIMFCLIQNIKNKHLWMQEIKLYQINNSLNQVHIILLIECDRLKQYKLLYVYISGL